MRSIIIHGAGGHGLACLAVAKRSGVQVEAFVDKDPQKWGQTISGIPIQSDLLRCGAVVFVAIGDNQTRKKVVASYQGCHSPAPLQDPSAIVLGDVHILTVVMPLAFVGPGAWVGEGVILNTGCIVEHNVEVQSYCHIAPGAKLLGGVKVLAGAFVGSGAVVLPGIIVGENAVVGAGAVVTRNVEPGTTVVGVPARTLRTLTAYSQGTGTEPIEEGRPDSAPESSDLAPADSDSVDSSRPLNQIPDCGQQEESSLPSASDDKESR